MSRTIGQIKTTITSRLHGTTLNKLGDFNVLCKDAAENMISRIDPQETIRKALLPNAVYDSINDYSLPSDFKAPIGLNDQANKINNSDQSRTYSNQFNNKKKDNQFAVVWQDGVQYLRFYKVLKTPIVLDKADSITENGTWTVSGNASNLTLDTLNYVSGTGSLKCDVSSPGSVVNVILKLGNDSSNYYSKTITAGHFDAFTTGWNLCRFDLSTSSLTGTVDMSSISYLNITVTYNTNLTATYEKTLTTPVDMSVDNYKTDGAVFIYIDFSTKDSLSTLRIDNITAGVGTLYDIRYYSNCLFRTTGGSWIEQPTSDSDIINLSPSSYKVFEAELSRIITQKIQGALGGFDFTYWNNELEGSGNKIGLYEQYEMQFPSERMEGQTDYWNYEDPFDMMSEDYDESGWGTNNYGN